MPSIETPAELAVVGVLLWPFIRLVLSRPFRLRLGGAPEIAIAIVAGLGAAIVVSLMAAMAVPWLLRALALAAILILAVAWWRGRPGYGLARSLPPGPLALAPLEPWVDETYYADAARRYGPIFKVDHVVFPTVCIVGLPLANELFRRYDERLETPPARFSRFIDRGFIRYMSSEDHATYGRLMRRAVSAAVVREAEADLAAIVRQELGRVADDRPIIAVASDRIALLVLLRLIFGITPDDPDVARLVELDRVLDPRRAWRTRPGRIRAALAESVAIVRRREPGGFLAAAVDAHPGALDDETLLQNFVFLAQTASADLGGLLAWVIRQLTDHPVWAATLRRDGDGTDLARRIVQETLRMEQSEFIVRRAAEALPFEGFVIPKGWRVRICVRESHRSAGVFDHPDVFDPDRFLANPAPSRDSLSPFGLATSRTTCLGEFLTMAVGRIFVEALVGGFDWTVVDDGPREFSGFHWRPRRRFRVALTAR